MSQIGRFNAYAEAFEKAFESDDWSLVEPFFTQDAVYETFGNPPFANRAEGRSAILVGLKQSLDTLDRRFDSRELEVLEGPLEREGRVWMRWRMTLGVSGAPDLVLEGEESAAFEGDRIRRLEDHFADKLGARVARDQSAAGERLPSVACAPSSGSLGSVLQNSGSWP